MRKPNIIIMTALLMLCSFAQAYEFNWEAKRQPKKLGEVSTFVSEVEGHAVKAFKGVVQVPYSVQQVVSLLEDHPKLPLWIYQSRLVIENIIPNDRAFYMGFNGIWPASDRDVVMDYSYHDDGKSGGIRVHVWNKPDVYPVHPKRVRIPIFDNYWHIFPADSGWTEVQFETFVDVGGSVPKWIANIIANDAPRRTLKGMRKMLDTGAYGPRRSE